MPMFERVLVVCDGNICRSPTVEAMLKREKPCLKVSSAGLLVLEGHDMESTARKVEHQHGLQCELHTARNLTGELCRDNDRILVMESHQKDRLSQRYPEASGKVFLLTQWNGKHDIPDPYRRGHEAFERIYPMMEVATRAWAEKL